VCDGAYSKNPRGSEKKWHTPYEAEGASLNLGKNLKNSDTGKVCGC